MDSIDQYVRLAERAIAQKRREMGLSAPRRPGQRSNRTEPLQAVVAEAFGHVHVDLDEEPVHIFPSTARKSAALGLLKFWRVWTILKHIDRVQFEGRGKFVVDGEILEAVAGTCGVSPLTVKRTLRDEAGSTFWRLIVTPQWRGDDILYVELVSHRKLEEALSALAAAAGVYDPYHMSPRKALLRLADFADLQALGAFCFASWLAVRKDGQFTGRWQDLESAWGRSRRTLEEWIRISGVEKQANFGYIPVDDTATAPALNASLTLDENNYKRTVTRNGQKYIEFQRANTYIAPAAARARVGRRGIAKRAAAHLRRGGDGSDFTRTNHTLMVEAREAYRRMKRLKKLRNLAPHKTHYICQQGGSKPPYGRSRGARVWDIFHYAEPAYAG